MDSERQRLGAQLRQRREARGMTLRELAERSGVNCANISKIEAGICNATADTLSNVAHALGAKLEIVDGEKSE